MMDSKELIEALRETSKVANKKLSKRTQVDYRNAYVCLAGKTPQEYRQNAAVKCKPITRERYGVLKAAYQWSMAQKASSAIQSVLDYQEQNDNDSAVIFLAIAEKTYSAFKLQKPDYDRLRYRSGLPAAHPVTSNEINKTKNSKRTLLAKLKKMPNWQHDLLEEMPEQHKLATALYILTGCRTKELKNGIVVEARDNELSFTIRGAKNTAVSGQRKRVLTFGCSKSKIVKELYEAVLVGTRRNKITIGLDVNERTYRDAHTRAACRAFGPKIGKGLSPYVHRHMLSADLKAEGYSREEIAMALGHSTDKTQTYYGMAQQSGGNSRGLIKIEASRQIKATPSAKAYFGSKSDIKPEI